jgi:hypothetical protein
MKRKDSEEQADVFQFYLIRALVYTATEFYGSLFRNTF